MLIVMLLCPILHIVIKIVNNAEIIKSIPDIVGQLKAGITRQANKCLNTLFVWQRSYYEHIIRNEKELIEIREYIANNILKWKYDKYYMN